MTLEGKQLIGSQAVLAQGPAIHGIDPSTGDRLEPGYPAGGKAEVERACELAWAAFDGYRETSLEERARFLETVADNIEAIGDDLITRAMQESGLPRARLEGERGRTCGQLRLFAGVVRAGEWLDVRIDPALPERQPMPR
ncbi:aldehyde dehydrogenase family protein, partial [Halomonas sp. V046]|uniref:aldehyde dehydrogenase family protein n=1 Tax=Halomonas sp. V046 TaxID=3459611 RepID=UPI0040444ECA